MAGVYVKNAKIFMDLNVPNALKDKILRSIALNVLEILLSTMENASVVQNNKVA